MPEDILKANVRRLRSRTNLRVTNYNNDGTISGYSNTPGLDEWSYINSFAGSKNPNWRAQVRAVTNATTPASGAKLRLDYGGYRIQRTGSTVWPLPKVNPGGYKRERVHTGDLYETGVIVTIPNYNPAAATSARNLAIAKLYSQLKSFQTAVEAGEDLGEITQTLKLLRSPVKPLRDTAVRLMRKHERILMKREGVLPLAKALADLRLEWAFGIKPLTSTLAKAYVGLKGRDVLGHYYPFSAGEQVIHDPFVQDGLSISTGVTAVRLTRRTTSTTSARYQGVWGIHVNINRHSVERVLGLELPDVLPTIYNLCPWSWLIDYMSNTGTIMDSWAVPWGGVRWCNYTERITATTNTAMGGFLTPLFHEESRSINAGYFNAYGTRFTRNVVYALPVPDLEFFPIAKGAQYHNVAAALVQKLPVIGALSRAAVRRYPNLPLVLKRILSKEVR